MIGRRAGHGVAQMLPRSRRGACRDVGNPACHGRAKAMLISARLRMNARCDVHGEPASEGDGWERWEQAPTRSEPQRTDGALSLTRALAQPLPPSLPPS